MSLSEFLASLFVATLPQLLVQILVIAAGVWLGLTLYHRRGR